MENECAEFQKHTTRSFGVIEFGRCPVINPSTRPRPFFKFVKILHNCKYLGYNGVVQI